MIAPTEVPLAAITAVSVAAVKLWSSKQYAAHSPLPQVEAESRAWPPNGARATMSSMMAVLLLTVLLHPTLTSGSAPAAALSSTRFPRTSSVTRSARRPQIMQVDQPHCIPVVEV